MASGTGTRTRRGWPQRILDIIGAACAAILAFTAVPAVLVLVVGNPLGGGLGHGWRPLPRDALCLLVVAAWIAWAACCAQLLRAVVAQVQRGDVGMRPSASVLDRVAARIAFGVLALTTLGTSLSFTQGAGASTPAVAASVVAVAASPPAGTTVTTTAAAPVVAVPTPAVAVAVAARTYAVQPDDSLWRIAQDLLGDGADWTALAALNVGRDFGGGERLVDPDQLREGWRLRVPSGAHGDRDTTASRARPGGSGHLPELVALGLGSVACAALARRASRRRRVGARFSDSDDPTSPPALPDEAIDTATLLQRFADVPALHSFEAANYFLSLALDGATTRPTVRAVCVSPAGVTFHFPDARHDDPPDGFVSVDEGKAWRVGHSVLDGQEPTFPSLPIVLPIGDDAEGTWFVPLEPGDVLPLLGEAAPALWRAARAAVGSWSWSETILITEDPDDPELHAEAAADRFMARHVLFCGDPTSLAPAVADRCAVVTMRPVAASDLTILVDRHAATLHPMGLVVRPHLQSEEVAQHMEALMATSAGVDDPTLGAAPAAVTGEPGRGARAPRALTPGAIDVRLLTMTPRLDGLQGDLPPNRARRAVELVAYLALHQPDVITSDRLRTRVLGSSDADAAAKTLFNTAYAARRAMGLDEDGEPLFPAGTRQGLYQLSPRVTVDVQRAVALVAAGKAQSDPSAAIASFRAALALVEGEPLANALAGYAWWEAEGHGGRISAALVDGACVLASLASDVELFDLARWGLEQARLVEPYSEALSRAAMEVAAAEGDADRLRLEWRDCQRRIDALDPGGSPSARTESLYGELSRRVLVGAAVPEGAHTLPAAGPEV